MPELIPILFGAGFTLAVAYALGVLLLRRLPAPPEVALAVGAVALSVVVFLLLTLGAAHWGVFLALGAAALASLKWSRSVSLADACERQAGRVEWILALAILAVYGLFCFVNALAPEILADGYAYHLGLVSEYVRLGRFPARIGFYEMAPQGVEMLFVVAYAFGRHSAAKVVEFGFLLATLPMFVRVGRRLRLPDYVSLAAAAFYFCAPVTGVTGSSSYTEAGGVFSMLVSFYLLLVWRDTDDDRYLLPAGLAAGFCYAVKMPGIFTVAAAALFVLAQRRFRAALPLAAGAAIAMAPWLLRNLWLTGNPFAPLMNAVFPNPYFHVATERTLRAGMRSLGSIPLSSVPWQLAIGGDLIGTFGPLLLALPLGLLALRRRPGRWCWAAAAILALPSLANTGARFLIPAFACAAFALAMALPRPAVFAAVVLQAVFCWPSGADAIGAHPWFRLDSFPWRAALRQESEQSYLRNNLLEYDASRMLQHHTLPDARVLVFDSVAKAYITRQTVISWQSAASDLAVDALSIAGLWTDTPSYNWKAEWPAVALRGIRFRVPFSASSEWDLQEIRLYSGADALFPSPQWALRAWPNPWEAPLALDQNVASRWRTWEPLRAGAFFEIGLGRPQLLSSAVLVTHIPAFGKQLEVSGLGMDGKWRALPMRTSVEVRPKLDLRLEAARAVRNQGFTHILTRTGAGGYAALGSQMAEHAAEWGMEVAGAESDYRLLRVK